MDQKIARRLEKLYYDARNPASFSGIDAIYREVNKRRKKSKVITRKEIREWLKTQDSYTLHKPARRRIKRGRVIVSSIDSLWQADLADLSSLSQFNDDFKWILVVIDVFSKYLWCVSLKSKAAPEVVRGFKEILSGGRKPKKIQTDQGTEFLNAKIKNLFSKHGIKSYTTYQDVKASVVERVIRTIKSRLWRYFTFKSSYRYIDDLQKIVDSYNHARHRSTGRSPADVSNDNEWFVWKKLYGDTKPTQHRRSREIKYDIGQKVRVMKAKKIFDKGFERNWSKEIFIINERIPRNPPVYRLKDLNDELVEGVFLSIGASTHY